MQLIGEDLMVECAALQINDDIDCAVGDDINHRDGDEDDAVDQDSVDDNENQDTVGNDEGNQGANLYQGNSTESG